MILLLVSCWMNGLEDVAHNDDARVWFDTKAQQLDASIGSIELYEYRITRMEANSRTWSRADRAQYDILSNTLATWIATYNDNVMTYNKRMVETNWVFCRDERLACEYDLYLSE